MILRHDLQKAYLQGFYGLSKIATNQIKRLSKQNADLAMISIKSRNPATCQYYLSRTSDIVWG